MLLICGTQQSLSLSAKPCKYLLKPSPDYMHMPVIFPAGMATVATHAWTKLHELGLWRFIVCHLYMALIA